MCVRSYFRLIILGHTQWHPAKHQFTWIWIETISIKSVCTLLPLMTLLLLNLSHCAHFHRAKLRIYQIISLSLLFSFSSSSLLLSFYSLLSQIFIDHWHVYHISIEQISSYMIFCCWIYYYFILALLSLLLLHFNFLLFVFDMVLSSVSSNKIWTKKRPRRWRRLERPTSIPFFGHLSFQTFIIIIIIFIFFFFSFRSFSLIALVCLSFFFWVYLKVIPSNYYFVALRASCMHCGLTAFFYVVF